MNTLIDRFDYSNCDYTDTYEMTIVDPDDRIGIDDVAAAFTGPGPGWVEGLMSLRHRIVAIFGLKTDLPEGEKVQSDAAQTQSAVEQRPVGAFEPGDRAGIFRVFRRDESEMMLGEDDKHLDFRVRLSLLPDGEGRKRVSATTLVRINNRLGRFYFFFVKPFHKIIVPRVMKHNLSRLNTDADRPRVV